MSEPAPFTHAYYRYLLQTALENGYGFIQFSALSDCRQGDHRVCLLRHDCDNDLVAAAALARIENEMGVQSTYFLLLRSAMYNLLSIPSAKLVREIVAQGHALGLHFDEHYYGETRAEEFAAHVDREREWLSAEFGVPVNGVSFHQPSPRVLNNQIKLNCPNTYDRQDMADLFYLSDSNTVWRRGSPVEFFRAREQPRVQLLLHPEWWTETECTVQEKWRQMLRHNFELMQESLLNREDAYTQRQQIEIHP